MGSMFQGRSLTFFFFTSILVFIFLQFYLLTRTQPESSIQDTANPPHRVTPTHLLASPSLNSSSPSSPPSPSSSSSSSSLFSSEWSSGSNTTPYSSLIFNTSFVLRPSGLDNISSLWKTYTGPTWSDGFCKDFLGTTYERKVKVCSDKITCFGSPHSKKMGKCSLKGVAIRPRELYNVMATLKVEEILDSNSVWLLGKRDCPNPSFREVELYIEKFDPIIPIIKMSTLLSGKGSSCQLYINGTTFFYIGIAKHIYFRFLSWYNLYRSLRQYREDKHNLHIIRLPEVEGDFHFPEFERQLFGDVIPLETLGQYDSVCFESVELVSWAYGAPLFRCKMDGAALKRKCLKCDGKGLNTDVAAFRDHIITGCSLQDKDSDTKMKKITVIERKRYERFKGDPVKKFKRIWINSEELMNRLKLSFPQVNVTGMYAETLPICDQIKLLHETDVLIAMHGAGLVHLWWLQPKAKVVELVPKSQRGNAAFTTLAKHLGRTHKLINKVTEKGAIVTVDVNKIIAEVKTLI